MIITLINELKMWIFYQIRSFEKSNIISIFILTNIKNLLIILLFLFNSSISKDILVAASSISIILKFSIFLINLLYK